MKLHFIILVRGANILFPTKPTFFFKDGFKALRSKLVKPNIIHFTLLLVPVYLP